MRFGLLQYVISWFKRDKEDVYKRQLLFVFINGIAAIIGLFFTSILIGIITTGIETKLQTLRNGNAEVLVNDHTVILGWNDTTFAILAEIMESNLNRKMRTVVVLDDACEKAEMDDQVRTFIAEKDKERERIAKKKHEVFIPVSYTHLEWRFTNNSID